MRFLQQAPDFVRGRSCSEDVDIARLRHDDKPCYVREGHGGKPVVEWPIYQFFHIFVHDSEAEAQRAFEAWYLDQFLKYYRVGKRQGGMRGGSLAHLVETQARHEVLGSSGGWSGHEPVLHAAIARRVEQRFNLVRSVITEGYHPNPDFPVEGVARPDHLIYLLEGHHRVAALAVLGYVQVKSVNVYRSRTERRLAAALRIIGRRVSEYGKG